MDPITLSLIISAGLGLVGGLFGNHKETQARSAQAKAAEEKRARVLAMMDEIRATDYGGVDALASRDFTRASGTMDAMMAARGLGGSGMAAGQQQDLLGNMLMGLAKYKNDDQRTRLGMAAGLLGDESFMVPEAYGGGFGDYLGAGLAGAAGGAGSSLGSVLGTEAGLEWLSSLSAPSPMQALSSPGGVRGSDRSLGNSTTRSTPAWQGVTRPARPRAGQQGIIQ